MFGAAEEGCPMENCTIISKGPSALEIPLGDPPLGAYL